jgi:hypothetical protein
MKPRHLIPAILLTLLIPYPLSIGPVMRWHTKRHPHEFAPPWVREFYRPIIAVCEHVPALGMAVDMYGELWGAEMTIERK